MDGSPSHRSGRRNLRESPLVSAPVATDGRGTLLRHNPLPPWSNTALDFSWRRNAEEES